TQPAKNAFSSYLLRFSNGSTAMLFSGMVVIPTLFAYDTGLACCFKTPKYRPASKRTQSAIMPPTSSSLLVGFLTKVVLTLDCPDGSWSRCATSTADEGRRDGSLARQAATTFSQSGGTNAGSISNSLRRSVIEGATRSQICRSILPE